MEIVADDEVLANELHGDLAVEFVRPIAEIQFIGGRFCVVIEPAGMGAAAKPYVALPLMPSIPASFDFETRIASS